MKLSSLDIRKQEFTRTVRGYDKEEVDAFLQLVANQWQEVVDDLRREEEKNKELNVKLEHYQKVEEALEEALKTARTGSKQTIENAEKKARLIIEEAESQSLNITKEAEAERLGIRKDAAKYSVRQKEIVAKLRAFLMSELEILAQYESEAPASYVKLIPADRAELVENLSNLEDEIGSIEDELPLDASVPEEAEETVAEEEPEAEPEDVFDDEEAEAVAVEESADEGKSPRKAGKKAAAGKQSKDPEVTDEIEKIRRILEDLEK